MVIPLIHVHFQTERRLKHIMLMTKIRPQRPDTPDIDDLIYGKESEQSTK